MIFFILTFVTFRIGSIIRFFVNNDYYKQEFLDACRSGDTRHLKYLIAEGKFRVNEPLHDQPPLIVALEERSKPVVALLLNNSADLTVWEGWPLNRAVIQRDEEMVRLLLDKGANPNNSFYEKPLIKAMESGQLNLVRLLLDHGAYWDMADYSYLMEEAIDFAYTGSLDMLEVLLIERMTKRLGSRLRTDEITMKLAKYLEICRYILANDKDRVKQLLEMGDYESYATILGVEYKPAYLAAQISGVDLIEAFLPEHLTEVFFGALRRGKVMILSLCLENPGLNLQIRDFLGRSVLHTACRSRNSKIIKVLVNKFKLDLEEKDKLGCTPLFGITNYQMLADVLRIFPDLNVNVKMNDLLPRMAGQDLLATNANQCDSYALLLENGADPPRIRNAEEYELERLHRKEPSRHFCHDMTKCPVVKYLKKMLILDQSYVNRIAYGILRISQYEFLYLCPPWDQCLKEIKKMKKIRLNRSTSTIPVRTLFDFMFFDSNEAARYSRNVYILKIYKKYGKDFRNVFPQYGFRLNIQLRRGKARRKQFESAHYLLYLVLQENIPQELIESIFGHFSNGALKKLLDYEVA